MEKKIRLTKETDAIGTIYYFIRNEVGWSLACKSDYAEIKTLFDLAVANIKKWGTDKIIETIYEYRQNSSLKIIVWKDGTHKIITDGVTYEFENDSNYLTTITI